MHEQLKERGAYKPRTFLNVELFQMQFVIILV